MLQKKIYLENTTLLRTKKKQYITFHIYIVTKKQNVMSMNICSSQQIPITPIVSFHSTYHSISKYTYIMICLCFDILICCFVHVIIERVR